MKLQNNYCILFNSGYFNKIWFEISNRVFIIYFKRTPLCTAVKKGNLEIIQLLLQNKRIDINSTNEIHINII